MAVAIGKRNVLKAGPWGRVVTTPDPYDGKPTDLLDARNVYIPDPTGGSGVYTRPGFVLEKGGTAVYTAATTFRGQGSFTHFGPEADPINFCVFDGHLFRADATLSIFTDVTPVGVTIDNDLRTRVYFADMGGIMVVSDGVYRPWIASNLNSTPITGTYINFDGAGTAWAAVGQPVVFGGSGFFILKSYNSILARLDIAWSEPNDWSIGYQQTNYDNRWTLQQTGGTALYALAPTNTALYYFRQHAIGAITGTVGPDLATTATHDAIASNVGTQSPQSIVQFGNTIFFLDAIGRPWRFPLGSAPEPIWLQLRGVVDAAQIGFPGVTAITSTAAFEPTLNLYCVAIWSPTPGSQASPTEWYSFDAYTGKYLGRWSIGPADPGVSVDSMGTFTDNYGRGTLVVLGSAVAGGVSGFVWGLSSLTGTQDFLGTNDLNFLATEDLVELVTEGQFAQWKDNTDIPLRTVQTNRMGYSEDMVWLWDAGTILTGTADPITVTVETPLTSGTLEGTPTPATSQDGVFRSTLGLDLQGREAVVTISPTTATAQWQLHRVSLTGVPSVAMQDDD